MTQRFIDRAEIRNTKRIGDNLLVEAACARTGCQQYLAKEVGLTGDQVVNVYRPEAVVFDRASLATFAGVPVTVGHPSEPVTADNWSTHAVGEVQDEVARDGERVRVTFRVRDAKAIEAIEGGLREISMGYSTEITHGDGIAPDGTPYQATQTGPITINHLALVSRARGGSELRIGDDASNWGAAPITDAGKEVSMTLRKIMVDGLEVETTDAGATAIKKLTDAVAAKDAEMAAEKAKSKQALEEKEAEIGTLKGKLKAANDAAMTPEKMRQAVKDRASLEADAKAVADGVDLSLDDAALKRAAVVSAWGDEHADPELTTDAEMGALFRQAVKQAKAKRKPDPFADAARKGLHTADADPWAFLDQKEAN